ncbi:retrovirus-related pol polyprotein from transposon TNT 1-94 [Tanacetum coccineum]
MIGKATWNDLVHSFEGPLYTKENRIMDLKLEYQTFRAKPTESLSQTYTRYKILLNELANDGVNLFKHDINVGFMNSLPEKWLTFSQGLRNANHTQTLDLVDIYERFVYEDNLIQRRYSDTKKVLITTPSSTAISTTFFSNNVIQDFQENSDDDVDERSSEEYLRDLDIKFYERALLANSKRFIKRRNNFSSQKANENTECYKCGKKGHFAKHCFFKMSKPSYKSPADRKIQKDYKAESKKMKAKLALLEENPSTSQTPKTFQPKNKGLVAETFNWDEEEVSDDEEVTQVKVLMALADDELTIGKKHAPNGKWIDITLRKGESPIPLPPLKNLQEDSLNKSVLGTVIVSETEPTTPLVPTEVKDTEQKSKINELTKLVQMLINEKVNSTQKSQESNSQIQQTELSKILYNIICKREDHRTSNHEMYTASLKRSENYKARPYQYASPSKHNLKSKAKPFLPCTHCGFNDHRPNDCRNFPECETMECNTCGSTVHSTTDHNEFDHFKRETHQGAHLVPGQWMLKEYDWCQELSAQICRATRMVENQNDVKVKQIRTDNGSEFRNHELESFCDEKGISQNFTSPYTPEQNGVAERKNRTLIQTARTMLNGSVLYWEMVVEDLGVLNRSMGLSGCVSSPDDTAEI